MKIKVNVPQKDGEKWKVSFGHFPSSRKDPVLIFRLIERRLLRTAIREKTSITVNYSKDSSNESLDSLDANYLLYTLSCFLEDYLKWDYQKLLFKKYHK